MASVLLAILAVVLVLAGLAAIVWWTLRPSRRSADGYGRPPLIFIPTDGYTTDGASAPLRPLREPEPVHLNGREPAVALHDGEPEPLAAFAVRDDHGIGLGRDGGAALASRRRERAPAVRLGPSEAPPSRTVLTGTLRMLPGRLEVVAGMPPQSEIRFVHTSDGPQQRVTIGRQDGPPYEHVQLASQTVSRLHAAMTFSHGRWSVANLSETNPLRVNAAPLPCGAPPVALTDGDVLELGEVVLRFHV